MVEQRQLLRAASLNQEYRSINQALFMFGDGAKILAMMIGPPLPDELRQPTGFMVRTDHMAYPAQMVTGITQQLTARRDTIRDELREMGVDVPDRPPPGPPDENVVGPSAQAAAAREARRAARQPGASPQPPQPSPAARTPRPRPQSSPPPARTPPPQPPRR